MRLLRADVSLRDVTTVQMGNGLTQCEWRHTLEARGGFWEILKKSVCWVEMRPATGEDVWLSLAHGDLFGRCHTCWGWQSQNRKILPLSPYVEEPLNSKAIKYFVLERRSRYVFFEFRDSYVLCIYVMNAPCTFSIFMYMVMIHRYHLGIVDKGKGATFSADQHIDFCISQEHEGERKSNFMAPWTELGSSTPFPNEDDTYFMDRKLGFNPWSSRTKNSKNGT